jgi:hexosaminidase
MPGHSLAALSCFPELSCSGGPFEIFPFFKGPNITEDILCAGRDATFEFLDNVLSEVIEIFPSPLIHVGGDEAPKARWKTCPHCQARMESEGLETEEQLQGYFLRRVEEMVSRHGRRLIGWTEIVDGGLGEEAAVMSWLGTRGAERASEAGHEVVMSPTSHCYFDYEYSKIDTRRAYSYEPVPEEFSARQATHILGLQANFWSHIDRTPDLVDRQLFPRLLAIAERGWSAGQLRDWDSFKERILPHLEALSRDGIQLYPDPSVYSEDAVQLP